MLAGLSQCWITSVPPGFWANAGPALASAMVNPTATATASRFRVIGLFAPVAVSELFIEPHVFHAQPVVNRVDKDRVALDVRVPARAGNAVVEHRPGDILSQFFLDFPDQPFALLLVRFHRLPVDHLIEFGTAIAVVIAFGAAGVVFV